MKVPSTQPKPRAGYILLEVILAVTVFSLSMVGFSKLLFQTTQTAKDFAQATAIQYGLTAILTEARHRDLDAMNLERIDEDLEIVYRTEVESMPLANEEGNNLNGLYKLTATATYLGPSGETTETAELWIYRDEDDNR